MNESTIQLNRRLTELKNKQVKPSEKKEPPTKPPRLEVLETAAQYISKDRNGTHGEPEDSFAFIAALWDAYLTQSGRLAEGETISRADVALMMALMKVARAAANPANKDSWIDIAGYAACGYEAARYEETKPLYVIKQTTPAR